MEDEDGCSTMWMYLTLLVLHYYTKFYIMWILALL